MSSPRHRAGRGEELTLAIHSETGSAGGSISGDLSGPTGSATVSLVRVEHSPSGTFMFVVSSCKVDLAGAPARFELEVPAALPPAVVGGRCRLDYVVRAEFAYSRWRRRRAVSPVAVTAGERPVHEDRGDSTASSPPTRRAGSILIWWTPSSRAVAT